MQPKIKKVTISCLDPQRARVGKPSNDMWVYVEQKVRQVNHHLNLSYVGFSLLKERDESENLFHTEMDEKLKQKQEEALSDFRKEISSFLSRGNAVQGALSHKLVPTPSEWENALKQTKEAEDACKKTKKLFVTEVTCERLEGRSRLVGRLLKELMELFSVDLEDYVKAQRKMRDNMNMMSEKDNNPDVKKYTTKKASGESIQRYETVSYCNEEEAEFWNRL